MRKQLLPPHHRFEQRAGSIRQKKATPIGENGNVFFLSSSALRFMSLSLSLPSCQISAKKARFCHTAHFKLKSFKPFINK
jgi:hypothetical protein